MDEERARRVGRNEALYRQVNERVQELNEAFGSVTGEFMIVCECGDIACTEQISVPREVYERVRATPTKFIVVPGHELPDVERVREDDGEYVVIEKHDGLPARVAAETDPRS